MMQDVFRRLLLLEGQAIPYSDANLNALLLNSKKDTTELYCKSPEPISHFDFLSFQNPVNTPIPQIHSIGSFTGQEVELSLDKNTCFD